MDLRGVNNEGGGCFRIGYSGGDEAWSSLSRRGTSEFIMPSDSTIQLRMKSVVKRTALPVV
jgi:hypothetical protein